MPHNILHVDSSPRGDSSISRKLTAETVKRIKAEHSDVNVTTRDLGKFPLPHLNAAVIEAMFAPPEQRTDAQIASLIPSDETVAELVAADTIVIGVPMWNLSVPSILKAWIDHIVREGKTFNVGADGTPHGLLAPDKKVIAVLASGGIYSRGPLANIEHQQSYMKVIFGILGLTDVTFVHAEGVKQGPDAVKAAIKLGEAEIIVALTSGTAFAQPAPALTA
jgi:FMN-dependent NADH-azoreductase